MSDLDHLIKTVEVSAKLTEGFKAVADLQGPLKAFYFFAGKVVEEGYPPETEERFVRLIRAVYDDYVADSA